MKITKILIAVNLFLLQSYLLRFHIGSYPSNLQEIMLGLTLVVFLCEKLKEKNLLKTIINIKTHRILIGLIALTILSTLFVNISNTLDYIRHIKFLFFALVFAFIFTETLIKKTEQEKALEIGGYGAIAFGILSVFFNLAGHNIAHDLRLLGPLDSAVYMGFYLTPFFIYFSAKSITKKTLKEKKKYIIPAIILGMLILGTRSMGSIGASFLIIVLYLFNHENYGKEILKKRSAKIIIALVATTILSAIIITKIIPTIQSPYSSLNERGEIWKVSIELLKEPKNAIFGLGFGQFEANYIKNADEVLGHQPLDYYVIQPHNIFLLFIFHYGIFGLAFIFFIITRSVIRFAKNKNLKELDKITLMILFYFFIHGMIDTPFFKNDIMILFILLLSLAYERPETRSIKTE